MFDNNLRKNNFNVKLMSQSDEKKPNYQLAVFVSASLSVSVH